MSGEHKAYQRPGHNQISKKEEGNAKRGLGHARRQATANPATRGGSSRAPGVLAAISIGGEGVDEEVETSVEETRHQHEDMVATTLTHQCCTVREKVHTAASVEEADCWC